MSSAGQGKFAGRKPTFYDCATLAKNRDAGATRGLGRTWNWRGHRRHVHYRAINHHPNIRPL